MVWLLGAGINTDLPRQVQQAKAAGHRDRLVPVLLDHGGGHLCAVLGHQRRIDLVPLRVQQAPEDGRADLLRGRFQGIQGRLGLQGRHVGCRQIKAGQFGHQVRGAVVDLADEHADMAHRDSPYI